MMKIIVAATLASAAAFAPAPAPVVTSSAAASSLDGMYGADVETGGVWDPLSFSELHGLVAGSEHANLCPHPQWLREAEIKHGRVAMLAFTGALAQSFGMHFPGSLNGLYYEAGVNPIDATASAFATNPVGMAQIVLWIGVTEGLQFPEGAWQGEMKRAPGKSHEPGAVSRGRVALDALHTGDYKYNFGMGGKDVDVQKLKELKNGPSTRANVADDAALNVPSRPRGYGRHHGVLRVALHPRLGAVLLPVEEQPPHGLRLAVT